MENGLIKAPQPFLAALEPPALIHILGIGGVGMSALAGLLVEKGFRVRGSDASPHPPVSDLLRDLGVELRDGYSPANLAPPPALAVVGNVIRRDNPEARALEALGIPFATLPDVLTSCFTQDRTRIVVTGTHGKTTTAAMIAHVLTEEGFDPGFFIGGLTAESNRSYRPGNGDCFVIEGDEYDTAYFEKTPKFLHYKPDVGVITSIEFDHGDIYPDLAHVKAAFASFAGLIPSNGALIAFGDSRDVREAARDAAVAPVFYGQSAFCDLRASDVTDTGTRATATLYTNGSKASRLDLAQTGLHNILNATAAVAAVSVLGVSTARAVEALRSFRGVRRRQELVGEVGGVTVIDDFAHHPTAVRETLRGVRARYPARRIVAVFEPRTNTSVRSFFQEDYVSAFLEADMTVICEPRIKAGLEGEKLFSVKKLTEDLSRLGRNAHAFREVSEILDFLVGVLKSGDVTLIMSTGAFGDLPHKLDAALRRRDP
jgi:UDP-N-acetylmuramate: L-alanyl-gamma-D-glutamyl-meso-diaminopimelate ligase